MARPEQSLQASLPALMASFAAGSTLQPDQVVASARLWEAKVVGEMARNPLDALMSLVLGGSALFYAAEKDINPKVRTFWDALYYISTCTSVGYADVFATTPAGKAISAVVFTFGPSLTARALERGTADAIEAPSTPPTSDPAILARLDAILEELKRRP